MKPFTATLDTIVLRFYLVMFTVIAPFFLGVPYLALFAVPLFYITLLGISFSTHKQSVDSNESTHNTLTYTESNYVLIDALT